MPMRTRTAAALGVALAMTVATGVVFASHQFADVPTNHQFHSDISWLADSGVTTGCGGGNFCPEDNVTRGQMAAFLHRYNLEFGSGETIVTALSVPWAASNGTVSITPDGVEFGPYANGGAVGGSLRYGSLDGAPLSDVHNLVYYMRYVSSADTAGVGAPLLRIFTDAGGAQDAISMFMPSQQTPDPDTAEGPFHEWVPTSGTWRYSPDGGAGTLLSFADLIAAHGTEPITSIYLTLGLSTGTDLAGLLRWMEINGERFVFRG